MVTLFNPKVSFISPLFFFRYAKVYRMEPYDSSSYFWNDIPINFVRLPTIASNSVYIAFPDQSFVNCFLYNLSFGQQTKTEDDCKIETSLEKVAIVIFPSYGPISMGPLCNCCGYDIINKKMTPERRSECNNLICHQRALHSLLLDIQCRCA